MSWFSNFVSGLTGDSTSKTSEAGHDARTDSGAREGKDDFSSAPDWAERTTEGGTSLFPDGK
jgi:hypothetical protein